MSRYLRNIGVAIWCCCLVLTGCSRGMYHVPANADPVESESISAILPLAENATFNKNGRLESIDLGGPAVTDEHLALLSTCRDLRALNLFGSKITDDGLANVKTLHRLRSLGLAWTHVSDAGIDNVICLDNLELLDLGHTQITDQSLKKLQTLRKLVRVFLSGTVVSDGAIAEFKANVPKCRVQR